MAAIQVDRHQFKERECGVLIKGVPLQVNENLMNIYNNINKILCVPNPPTDVTIKRLRDKVYRPNTILLTFPDRATKLRFYLNYRQYIKHKVKELKAYKIGFNARITKYKLKTENSTVTIAEHLNFTNYIIYKKAKHMVSCGIINEVVTHMGLVYYSNDVVTNQLVTNVKQFNVKFK